MGINVKFKQCDCECCAEWVELWRELSQKPFKYVEWERKELTAKQFKEFKRLRSQLLEHIEMTKNPKIIVKEE